MSSLRSCVIAITGASSGIGAATALALAPHCVKLCLAARRVDRLEAVAAKCRALGSDVLVIPTDVAQREECFNLVTQSANRFGRLDVMLANAGYGFLAKVHETTEEQFDDIVATNVKGTWHCMQAAAEMMLKQPSLPHRPASVAKGHIIAMSSGAARRGLPLYGLYAMTKAAQLSLCEAMRVELLGRGVYVSSVHPMTTATEFFEVASSKSALRSLGLSRPQSADVVGRKIVQLMANPRPELWPVFGSSLLLALAAAIPSLGDWSMARSIWNRTRT